MDLPGTVISRALHKSLQSRHYLFPFSRFCVFSTNLSATTLINPSKLLTTVRFPLMMSSKYESVPWLKEKPITSPSDSSRASEESEDLLEHNLIYQRRTFRERLDSKWLWLTHAFLLLISCSLFILSIANQPSTLQHVRQYSAWSPADSSVRYEKVKYNITTEGNPFVGAGPEVDRAWREISYDMGDQWISKSDISRLGMPETSLKVDHPKTGEEGYRVGIEVFHHLHCINLLRRVTYKSYYEPLGGEFEDGPEALKGHTGISACATPSAQEPVLTCQYRSLS